jgi:hypothetical protein
VTPTLPFDRDSARVFAHLDGHAEPLARTEPARRSHLGDESCIFRIGGHFVGRIVGPGERRHSPKTPVPDKSGTSARSNPAFLEENPQIATAAGAVRQGCGIALNMAEASGSRGGSRNMRYRSALGSAREAQACIDVALALGYVDAVDDEVRGALLSVQRVLVKIVA